MLLDLSSYLLLLGELENAEAVVSKAVKIMQGTPNPRRNGLGHSNISKYTCMLERVRRQREGAAHRNLAVGQKRPREGEVVAPDGAVASQGEGEQSACTWGDSEPVDVRDARTLSMQEFMREYAVRGVPVVITNAACEGGMFDGPPWTFAYIKQSKSQTQQGMSLCELPNNAVFTRTQAADSCARSTSFKTQHHHIFLTPCVLKHRNTREALSILQPGLLSRHR
jgi:hypothetical protein